MRKYESRFPGAIAANPLRRYGVAWGAAMAMGIAGATANGAEAPPRPQQTPITLPETNLTRPPVVVEEASLRFEISDQALKDELIRRYQYDETMQGSKLDIKVSSGVVSLSGTAPSYPARKRAEEVAEDLRGVRAIENTIEVKGNDRELALIRAEVDAALKSEGALGLDVSYGEGRVAIEGEVANWAQRDRIEQALGGIKGVRALDNGLKVKAPAQPIPDAELDRRLNAAFGMRRDLGGANLKAKVENGKAILTGTVRSAGEKRRVMDMARVLGVKDVDALGVEISPDSGDRYADVYGIRTDEEIENNVTQDFVYDRWATPDRVKVQIKGGVATLIGEVDNLQSRRELETNLRNIAGIREVKNELKVTADEKTKYDGALSDQLKAKIASDGGVDTKRVTVQFVENGTAVLDGVVATEADKMHAEQTLERQQAVKAVRNNLKVETAWKAKNDPQIKADIERQYFWSAFVDGGDIAVGVKEGDVTLTGEVDSPNEEHAAIQNAYEAGAKTVTSKLRIKYGPTPAEKVLDGQKN